MQASPAHLCFSDFLFLHCLHDHQTNGCHFKVPLQEPLLHQQGSYYIFYSSMRCNNHRITDSDQEDYLVTSILLNMPRFNFQLGE